MNNLIGDIVFTQTWVCPRSAARRIQCQPVDPASLAPYSKSTCTACSEEKRQKRLARYPDIRETRRHRTSTWPCSAAQPRGDWPCEFSRFTLAPCASSSLHIGWKPGTESRKKQGACASQKIWQRVTFVSSKCQRCSSVVIGSIYFVTPQNELLDNSKVALK